MTEEDFKQLIDALKIDIRVNEEMIAEVAGDIIAEGFSAYPVFIATEHEVKVGELIIDNREFDARFNIYATSMEELLERGLIKAEKKDDFIRAYKNPAGFMCFMLITSEIASYIFVPFTKGGNTE